MSPVISAPKYFVMRRKNTAANTGYNPMAKPLPLRIEPKGDSKSITYDDHSGMAIVS